MSPAVAPGRNDPCPCGSGKKHKKCCMEKDRPMHCGVPMVIGTAGGREIAQCPSCTVARMYRCSACAGWHVGADEFVPCTTCGAPARLVDGDVHHGGPGCGCEAAAGYGTEDIFYHHVRACGAGHEEIRHGSLGRMRARQPSGEQPQGERT